MKKTRKGFKRILTFVVASLILIANVNAYSTTDFLNAQNGGTPLTTTYSSNIGKAINAEYTSFAIGVKGTPTVKISGKKDLTTEQKNAYLDIENFIGESLTDKQKESLQEEKNSYQSDTNHYMSYPVKNFSATYEQVGTYNDHIIDVKLTLMDFQNSIETNKNESDQSHKKYNSASLPPYVYFKKNMIGIGTHNVNWVDVKIDFIDHQTGESVNLKGNTTYWDVDLNQGILLDSTNKGIYISNSSNVLKHTTIDSRNYVFDPTNNTNCGAGATAQEENRTCNANELSTPTYAFTEIFQGQSLRRTFNFLIRTTDRRVGGAIDFNSQTVTESELPDPVKKVNKSKVKREQEYEYTITQKISNEIQSHYLKSLTIEDTLENVLDAAAANVTVKNLAGTNVTNNFDINVSGQKITVSPKAAFISSASFYGDTYYITIKTKVKAGADLTSYKQGNDYVIPNHATRTYKDYANKDYTKDTNIVKVIVEPYKLIIHHLEEGTNKKLADDESYNKEYNEKYSTSKSEKVIKDGYTLVSTPSNASGVIIKDTEVTYYYKKQSSIIVEVPKTLANVSKVLLVVGILAIVISVVVIYNNTRKEKSKK